MCIKEADRCEMTHIDAFSHQMNVILSFEHDSQINVLDDKTEIQTFITA